MLTHSHSSIDLTIALLTLLQLNLPTKRHWLLTGKIHKTDTRLFLTEFWQRPGLPRYLRTFIFKFACSHCQNGPIKLRIFQLKLNSLFANSRFAIQNDWTYLPRITRKTCTHGKNKMSEIKVKSFYKKMVWNYFFQEQILWWHVWMFMFWMWGRYKYDMRVLWAERKTIICVCVCVCQMELHETYFLRVNT